MNKKSKHGKWELPTKEVLNAMRILVEKSLERLTTYGDDYIDGFLDGANWQKEQGK